MFKKIKEFFVGKPQEVAVEAPYKVEVAPTPVAEQATQAVVESIAKPAAAKKPSAAKKPPAAKKPRATRKPKAS
jgi:hypothetical protein